MELLDQVIQNGDFLNYIITLFHLRAEERDWEYFLHKVFDQSFQEFKDSLYDETLPDQGEQERVTEKTFEESYAILSNFKPPEAGEEAGDMT